MLSEVDLWFRCSITISEIPILGGIWLYLAVFQKPKVAILDFKMIFGDNFWPLSVILVKETLILAGISSFSVVFQTSEVAILQFKMWSEVDLWLQCIITIAKIPIFGHLPLFFRNRKSPSWISNWHLETISGL